MNTGKLIRAYEDSTLAEDYEKFRPGYPSYVVETIMNELRKVAPENTNKENFDRMLDVACGTGQSTYVFKSYFNSILGIDISEAQISVAKEKNYADNIQYQVVHDNIFPVEDDSIDLITCATAAHFLDRKIFTEECNRVLKPNGCAVIYTISPIGLRLKLHTDGDSPAYKDFSNEYFNIMIQYARAYYPNYHVMEKYVSLFEEIENSTKRVIETRPRYVKYTLAGLMKHWSTLGEYRKLMEEENPAIDPLQVMENRLKELLGIEESTDEELEMICPYTLLLFEKQV